MADRSKSSGKSKSATPRTGRKKTAKKGGAGKKAAVPKKVAAATAQGESKKTRAPKTRKKPAPQPAAAAQPVAGTLAEMAPPAAAERLGFTEPDERPLPPVKIPKRDLTAIAKGLAMIRAQLTQDVSALTQNNLSHSGRDMSGDLSGYGFHMADVATDNFAREMELNIATGETDRLRLVEEALDRLNDNTFGRCLECGDPVGVPRLRVIPYARLCIRCAEEAERG